MDVDLTTAGVQNTLPAGAACTGTGGRCRFLDSGGATDAATVAPPLVAPLTDAGSHPDLRILQRIDYGGNDVNSGPTSNSDDPVTNDPNAANPPALKGNVLHFPPGLVANPTATATKCKVSGAAPSLIGDPAKFGSADPVEDTCLASSKVGTVVAVIRVPDPTNAAGSRLQLTAGDVYNGVPLGSETARLFVALRPACSAGAPTPINPGGPVCSSTPAQGGLGSPNVEVEKSFLSAKATVRTSDSGIDNETTSVATGADEPLARSLNVRVSATGGETGSKVTLQVRQLTQTLFGFADQATAAGGDDKSFIALPTSCAAKVLTADITTYADASLAMGSGPLQATNCAGVPFAPTLTATLDASGGQQNNLGHPTFEARITQADNESATSSAEVILPEGLGTDLNRLTSACTQDELASAAGCPADSQVGSSTATTPVLPGTLAGPVFLVAQTSGLPKLVVLLDGPLKLRLDGTIAFSGGTRLINRFEGLPEVPLSTFTIKLDGGTNGLLQNTRTLCNGLGNVNGTFNGYNGATVARDVPLAINGLSGCTYPTPYPIPSTTAKKPKVKVVIRGLKKEKPRMLITIRRRGGLKKSRIRTVRFTLPKGVRFSVKAKKRLLVKAGSKRDKSFTAKKRAFRNPKLRGGPAVKTTVNTRKSGIAARKPIQRRGSKQKLTLRFRIKVQGGKTFKITKKVRPKS